MKYIIGVVVCLVLYVGALLWKNTRIEEAKNLHLPTIYEIQKKEGLPVSIDVVKKGKFQEFITISGNIEGHTLKSFVPPFVRNKIRYGESAKLELEEGSKKFEGKVSYVTNEPNYLTGLFEIQVRFPGALPKNLGAVTVEIPVKEFNNVVLVPREAVSNREKKPVVYTLVNNKLVKKYVEVSASNSEVHWVKSGVSQNEKVVVSDTRYFEGGELVKVISEAGNNL